VTQRDHESLAEHDPHSLLFGPHEDEGHPHHRHSEDPEPHTRSARRRAQREHTSHRRRRRNRGVLLALAFVVLLVVGLSAWLIVPKVVDMIHPPDYSGDGQGTVSVTIGQGDGASDIGDALHKAGVVKSVDAFVNAAGDNSDSQSIQPGTYVLHRHMSAKNALTLLLDPKSRSTAGDLVITEGATVFDVKARLAKVLGVGQQAAIDKALADPSSLGIPLGYRPATGDFTSIEGFLYPATYTIDPKASPSAALQRMTSRFAEHDRSSGFAADAQKVGLTPYDALIIASIAQSEARFPDDMAKVARVILNRIAAKRPLQIDATSAYAAKVQGLDPTKIIFAEIDSPYNSYTHDGLPPTPISNPGAEAMTGAVHPTPGNWLYYVNKDSAGHLFFTNDETAFTQAVEKCRQNNWGCG
jgi:peptidoglycan lytic transglycosylase G